MLRKVLLLCVFGWCFPFKLKCPSESQWPLRARAFCPSDTSKYSCILNDLIGVFTEDCAVVEFERGGTKTIFRGNMDAVTCCEDRYQPGQMKYSTNVSSVCVFSKSLCSEEGQILYDKGSPTQDVECRCDYRENYDFISRQNKSWYCKPSEEDCVCFKKQCPTYYVLSTDYACVLTSGITNEPLLENTRLSRNETEIQMILQSNITQRERFNLPSRTAILLILILIIVVFVGPFYYDKELDKFIDQHIREVYFVRNLKEEVTVIEGKSVDIICELSKEDVAIQWFKDGSPIQFTCERFIKERDGRNYKLIIMDSKMEDDGAFTLQAELKTSHVLNLKVIQYFTTNSQTLTSAEGQTVLIKFKTVESISDVTCLWFFNDDEIKDSEKYLTKQSGVDCQLTIKNVKPIDSGVYQIRIGNLSGRTELKVQSYFKADLRPIPCFEGGECLLECEVTDDDDNMPAVWFKDGNQIKTSERVHISMTGTTHQLKIWNVNSDDYGVYQITVNNVSRKADVKVIDLISKPLKNMSCMEGLRAVLVCEVADKKINAKWLKDGKPVEAGSDIFTKSSEGIHTLCINQTDKNSEGQYQINVGNRKSSACLKITAMPDFIRRMPLEDRETYMRTARHGTMKRRHIRIMIVGKYSAGKTCLMRRLLNEEIDDVESTNGINVEVRRCKVRISDGQWIFSDEKCYKQDFDGKFKIALSANIDVKSHPESLDSNNIEQLDLLNIHSDSTKMSLHKDKTTAAVVENIGLNGIIQDSNDTQTTEFVTSKRSSALKGETSVRVTEINDNLAHTEFQQKSKSLDENEMINTQEVSRTPMSIQKCNVFENKITNEGNTEQTTEVKMKTLNVLQRKQIHIENKESDQLYLLSNILQSGCFQENIECVDCDFWDFAGQKDFYATHQTFLTTNAIYLLTIDISSFETDQPDHQKGGKPADIGEYANYWLNCIHCYSTQNQKDKKKEREPPIIIVCTGIDKVKDFQKVKESFKRHLAADTFMSHPKGLHIRDIVFLSNKDVDRKKIDILRSKIWKTAKSMSSWEDELPLSWIHLEKRLQVTSETENIVSLEDVMKISGESPFQVTNEEDIISFLRVQHEMGNIVFFHRLREYIILNPVWLIEAFKCLVSSCEFQKQHLDIETVTQIADTGEIQIDIIEQLFTKVPKFDFFKHKDHLLKVMEEFDIIVRPKTRRTLSIQGYYIPCLIKNGTFETESEQFDINGGNCQRTPWVCLEFDFLPPAFFNHILVRLIRIYHVSVKSRLALYSRLGVYDLNKSATYKLALCTENNTIAFQVWRWAEARLQFVNIRTKIEEIVNDVIKRYRMDIKYEVKYKCKTGTISELFVGRTASELIGLTEYCCSEHNITHETKEIIDVWMEQKLKGFLEETIDRECNKQIKCTSCGLAAINWCYNCEKAICNVCNEKHSISSSDHIVANLLDKYVLKTQFVVDKASICDIKMQGETIIVADFTGDQLLLYSIKGVRHCSVPLSKGPRKIAIVDNNRVAVRLHKYSKVVIVDLHQSGIFEIDIKEKCHGIMCTNNKLYVGCDDDTIRVFGLNGEKIKTINMPIKPWYICCDSRNRIFCTEEYNAKTIYCFDQNGKEHFYGNNTDIVGAGCITIDDNGCILVSCKNSNNVHRINPNDKKSEKIISKIPGLSTDWFPCICFDSKSESVIIAREDKVYVYALIRSEEE